MSTPSIRPSQRESLLASINPQSATTVQTSGWVNAANFEWLVGIVKVGAITTGGTVNAKMQQAKDSSGTSAKDITNSSITALTAAGSNSNEDAWIEVRADQLDTNNGFTYVRLSITPSGAAALIGGDVLGLDAKQALAGGQSEETALAQIVSLPSV